VAFLEFENGVPATIVHNGYGYFSTYELVPWAGSSRYRAASAELRRAIRAGRADADQAGPPAMGRGFQGDLGIVLVSCARGDVRQSPNGLWVYDDDGQREVPVEGIHDERMAELDEMYQALATGRSVRHDGRWGTTTLEVVLAMRQSAQEHREIMLSHQCEAY
jgi:phthalate 4,5-cis-dihydrodiol dehydrogenase